MIHDIEYETMPREALGGDTTTAASNDTRNAFTPTSPFIVKNFRRPALFRRILNAWKI
jgi:hypothetical protein